MNKNSFYPLGYTAQTAEEIEEGRQQQKLSEYLGVPFGVIDEGGDTEQEKDWARAQYFILTKKKIPQDLEKRLLKRKAEREKPFIPGKTNE